MRKPNKNKMADVNSRFASVSDSIFNVFLLKMLLRSLSVYMLKQVFFSISVGNQMQQVFPQKIFRKKGNTFRGIPLFSFSPELPEIHCAIYIITLVPYSLAKISDFAREWRPPSCLSVQYAVFILNK